MMLSNSVSTSNKKPGRWWNIGKPYKLILLILCIPVVLFIALFLLLAIPFSIQGYHCRHNLPKAWSKIQIPSELVDNGSPENNFSPSVDVNCGITHTYSSNASTDQICSDLLKTIRPTGFDYSMIDCGHGIDPLYNHYASGGDKSHFFITVYLNIQNGSATGALNNITISIEPS